MKRLLFLTTLFLAACSTAEISPASVPDLTPPPAALGMNSTSAQIQRAMLEQAARWVTLQMEGTITWYAADGSAAQTFQEKVWLDPLNSRYRVELTGLTNSADRLLKLSDGVTGYNIDLAAGSMDTAPFPEFARVGQFIPPVVEGESYPNPIWGQIGTPLSQLAFPSDYAQNSGIFKPLSLESVAGREALVVEWRFSEGSAPSWKLWLDTSTALILKLQEFSKDGSGILEGERTLTGVLFNPTFDPALFTAPANLPQNVSPTNAAAQPPVTESSPASAEQAGELYFFLQPRGGGGEIQLARVSGACVYDSAACPPLEILQVPFPFNFTINALSWSPDGRYAAFAYSDQPNGTPTKLWRFDPASGLWASLADFPYIDPPFWSPDGSWIAFRTQDGLGGEGVYLIRPDGEELKSISSGLPADGRPYIMDGWYTENVVVRPALPGSSGTIYLVRAIDGFTRPMFETFLTKAQFVAAPDASLLAYADYDPGSRAHVVKVMEPDGANAVSLANFTGGSIYPMVWSPDSRLIAFNYYGGDASGEPKAEVFLVGRDGSNLASVYRGMTVGRLVFSPNGRYLLVEETTSTTGGHLFVVDLATLEQRILQAPGLSTDFDWYAPSWRP